MACKPCLSNNYVKNQNYLQNEAGEVSVFLVKSYQVSDRGIKNLILKGLKTIFFHSF